MGRYDNELIYNRLSNSGEIRKAQTIRIIDRTYDKETSLIHIVKFGDNLMNIAKKYYDAFEYWYLIADKNPHIANPFELVIGSELVVPELKRGV